MTSLRCSVNNCAHHAEGCCCKPTIKVEGSGACKCDDTCCHSFRPRGNESTNSASYMSPNMCVEVSCNATDCVHNKNCKCGAECACVNCTGDGTECSTFRKA